MKFNELNRKAERLVDDLIGWGWRLAITLVCCVVVSGIVWVGLLGWNYLLHPMVTEGKLPESWTAESFKEEPRIYHRPNRGYYCR